MPKTPQGAIWTPDLVTDEAVKVLTGDVLLLESEVELMKDGILPERVSQAAHRMLSWKRAGEQFEAREKQRRKAG